MGRNTRDSSGGAGRVRELNRLRIVDVLRERGLASRAELGRITGLSRTTISSIVSDLQTSGLVVERTDPAHATPRSGSGRPPVLLALNPAAGAAAGVAFDHRHLRVAVADLSATVLAEREMELDVDHDSTTALDAAAGLLAEVVAEARLQPEQLIGAGMGLPGPIDNETGTVGSTAILPGWAGLRPGAELSARLGLPVVADNDANLGALAELLFGAARGASDAVYIKVSSGIGAGLVLGKRVYRGAAGNAGELGHVQDRQEGAVCRCGNRGCLETVASTPVLCKLLAGVHGPDLTIDGVLELVRRGDVAATRVIDEAGRAIGRVLADLCNVLNLGVVVVGGEIVGAGEPFLSAIRQTIDRRALPAAAAAVDVRPAALGDRAEILGALALVIRDTQRIQTARPTPANEQIRDSHTAHLTHVAAPVPSITASS